MKKLMGFVLLLAAFSSFAEDQFFMLLTKEMPSISKEDYFYGNGKVERFGSITEDRCSIFSIDGDNYPFRGVHKKHLIKIHKMNNWPDWFSPKYMIEFAFTKIITRCNTSNYQQILDNLGIKARKINTIKNFNLYLDLEEMLFSDTEEALNPNFVAYVKSYLNAKKDNQKLTIKFNKEHITNLSNVEFNMLTKIQRDI